MEPKTADEWAAHFWVYLDTSNRFVAWEAYRGRLLSSGSSPHPDGWSPVSVYVASMIRKGDAIRLQHELWMESIRQAEFHQAISRLLCMWYFPDRLTAERAPREWKEAPTYFAPKYLAEVGFEQLAPFSRHDSNWIDQYMFGPNPFTDADNDWAGAYWAGEACPQRAPIWELLVDGSCWVWGTDLRTRAHDTLAKEQPRSLAILELARVAADVESNLGHCAPLVRRTDDAGGCSLTFLMDFRDATDRDFLARLCDHKGPKNTSELNAKILKEDGLTTPDFRDMEFDFVVPNELAFLL